MKHPDLHFDVLTRNDNPLRSLYYGLRAAGRDIIDRAKGGASLDPYIQLNNGLRELLGVQPSAATALESMFWYETFGQQAFMLGKRLQAMFSITSLKNLPRDAIRLPYPCIYVATPDSEVQVWGGNRTQWHRMRGFYMLQVGSKVLLLMWGGPNKHSHNELDDATAWVTIDLDEAEKFSDLETYLADMTSNPLRADHDEGMGLMAEHAEDPMRESYHTVLRLGLNMLLYLQSDAREAEVSTRQERENEIRSRLRGKKNLKKGKAKYAMRELENLSDAIVTRIAPTIEAQTGTLPTRSTARRHWVQGHWKRVWVGSADERRKEPRWVMPYERNRDMAAAINRRYYEFSGDLPDPGEDR